MVAPARGNNYPLSNTSYRQPAGTTEFYFATAQVRFPAGCTRNRFLNRVARIDFTVNNVTVIFMGLWDTGTGQVTRSESAWGVAPQFITAAAHTRNVRARVEGECGRTTDPHPQVLSVRFHVVRFR